MKRTLFLITLISLIMLSACAPALATVAPATAIPVVASPTLPAPSATPLPAATATPVPPTATSLPPTATPLPPTPTRKPVFLRWVVLASDQTIQLVNSNLQIGPTYKPAFTGFLPAGDASAGMAYVLNFSAPTKAEAVDSKGAQHDLSFIKNANYGLAVWHGSPEVQPRLAWGTQPTDKIPSALNMSNPDGSQLQTLYTLDASKTPMVQLLAEGWSADGKTLYFSKEPYGIGGYILFSGASNLYSIDINTKKVTEIIPQSSRMLCLDALSADFRFVADHCTDGVITVRDLANHTSTSIQPPAGVKDFHAIGGARFSPDGKRVAFALGKNDPSAEQGWVAVSDGASGGSKLILTGQAGLSYTISGWLDDNTLLVQSNAIQCTPTCGSQLWTVGADGSNPVKVADGMLLAVVDNR